MVTPNRVHTTTFSDLLANRWQTAVRSAPGMEEAVCWTRPVLLVWVWSPPPESNRRPHPYHGSAAKRRAIARCCRSRSTVDAAVMGSVAATAASSSRTALASPARRTRASASARDGIHPTSASTSAMLGFQHDDGSPVGHPCQPSAVLGERVTPWQGPPAAGSRHVRFDPARPDCDRSCPSRTSGSGGPVDPAQTGGCWLHVPGDTRLPDRTQTPLAVAGELRGTGRSRWDRRTGAT